MTKSPEKPLNPYAVGKEVGEKDDQIEGLFRTQRSIAGIVGGIAGAIISIVVFEVINQYISGSATALSLVVFGAIVGLSVRWFGHGFQPVFRLIAAFFTFVAQFWLFGRAVTEWTGLAAIYVGLFIAGIFLAATLARRALDDEESRLVWKAQMLGHAPRGRFIDSWIVLVPLMFLAGAPLVYTLSVIVILWLGIPIPWLMTV